MTVHRYDFDIICSKRFYDGVHLMVQHGYVAGDISAIHRTGKRRPGIKAYVCGHFGAHCRYLEIARPMVYLMVGR